MGFFDKPEVIGPGSGSDADRARIAELEKRVARLEALVAQSQVHATNEAAHPSAPSEAWLAEVQELRRSGKVIHAIKLYRARTGVGLKEAKDAVEALPG